ncbi:hypothetical protein ACOSQ3_014436 [Xanthoceras sorbifolium]
MTIFNFYFFNCRVKQEYRDCAKKFVEPAKRNARNRDLIVCPCKICQNLSFHPSKIVYEHLVIKGMDPTYTNWVFHGEHPRTSISNDKSSNTFRMYRDVFFEDSFNVEPEGNIRDEDLTQNVEDAETPLYDGSTKYTKLSAIVVLYKHKATHGLSDKGFDELLGILRDMLPQDNVLPDSLYSTKKLLKVFDLGYEKIHACVNDCCLFRKELGHLEECPRCGDLKYISISD